MAYCAPSAVVPVICFAHVRDDGLTSRRAAADAECVGATGDWSPQAPANTKASDATARRIGWGRYMDLLSVRVVDRLSRGVVPIGRREDRSERRPDPYVP